MKLGFNEATAKECSDLLTDIRLCEKERFDYLEIRMDMLQAFLKEHTIGELKQAFAGRQIRPHAMNALYTYQELFGPKDDPARRKALEEEFLFGCQIAREIGSTAYIVVPPLKAGPFDEAYDGDLSMIEEDCVRILRKLSEMAKPYDVRLGFELVGAKKSSVRSLAAAKSIIEKTDRENVGYVVDTANIHMYGKIRDYEDMKSLDVNKIFAVHINDYEDVPEEEFSLDKRCFCGSGAAGTEQYVTVLKEMGYQGMVSIEVFRPEYWAKSPEWVIAEAYRTTRELLERCGCAEGSAVL